MTSWLLLAEAGAPEGGLFDLDATLPLMAAQVVLLTLILNSLFFRPVGRAVEEREGYVSTSRERARREIESQRDQALAALSVESDRLGALIVDRLLAAQ